MDSETKFWILFSLGIELTKIMVLQYSNQETSVTIGESVRDEDGKYLLPRFSLSRLGLSNIYIQSLSCRPRLPETSTTTLWSC